MLAFDFVLLGRVLGQETVEFLLFLRDRLLAGGELLGQLRPFHVDRGKLLLGLKDFRLQRGARRLDRVFFLLDFLLGLAGDKEIGLDFFLLGRVALQRFVQRFLFFRELLVALGDLLREMSPLGLLFRKFFGETGAFRLDAMAMGFPELREFGIVVVALFVEGFLVLVDTGAGLGQDELLGLESLRVGGKFLLVGLELGMRRGQLLLLLRESLLAGGNFLVMLEMIGLLVGDFRPAPVASLACVLAPIASCCCARACFSVSSWAWASATCLSRSAICSLACWSASEFCCWVWASSVFSVYSTSCRRVISA